MGREFGYYRGRKGSEGSSLWFWNKPITSAFNHRALRALLSQEFEQELPWPILESHFSAALSLKLRTAGPLGKCGILRSSGSCPCLEQLSLGLNRLRQQSSRKPQKTRKDP